jgi:hypothetical protein
MDNWQPGDLALCVHDKTWHPNKYSERSPDIAPTIISALFPRVGSEWVVSNVEVIGPGCLGRVDDEGDLVFLGLQGQPSGYLYDARCFRKIDKLTDEERDSFLADILTPETV